MVNFLFIDIIKFRFKNYYDSYFNYNISNIKTKNYYIFKISIKIMVYVLLLRSKEL